MIPLADSQLEIITSFHAYTSPNYISPLLVLKHGKYKQFISSKSYCLFLLLLVLNFIKELEGRNTHVPLCYAASLSYLQTHYTALQSVQSAQQSSFIQLNPNNGLAQKPTVQHSFPLQIMTALMASSGILLLPSLMPVPLITAVLNFMISLGITSM